jgi:hypothetical protein
MGEGKEKPGERTRIIQGETKPKPEEGIRWVAIKDNPWKLDQISGWMAVSTKPSQDLSPEMEKRSKEPSKSPFGNVTPEQLEESAKKGYPTFIEESQPTGDKD